MSTTIRNTTISELKLEEAGDIQQVLDIEKEAFDKGAIHQWVLAPFVISQKVLLCRIENEIAGMGIFLKSFNKSEVFFFSFALKKKFQGKGLGRFFFGKTVEYIFENYSDIKSIKLTVDPLIPKNIKLFKSFGFSEIQYFKNFYGNGIDRIYMELKRENFKI